MTVPPPDRAHAAAPGSGPAGKMCGDCKHLRTIKCHLIDHHRVHGLQSDVRHTDAACFCFEDKVGAGSNKEV